jgi:L-alanine-DL-glutamate epimerase-like enolase superfamily enzyme
VQYDLVDYGLTRWLETGRRLDAWGRRSAPHHYGTCFGNYAACHLAATLARFAYVEWDEARVDGLEAPGYSLADGMVTVPATPGFGLVLDEEVFLRAVEMTGFTRAAP